MFTFHTILKSQRIDDGWGMTGISFPTFSRIRISLLTLTLHEFAIHLTCKWTLDLFSVQALAKVIIIYKMSQLHMFDLAGKNRLDPSKAKSTSKYSIIKTPEEKFS